MKILHSFLLLVSIALPGSVLANSQGDSNNNWKKGDGLGAKVMCTGDYSDTCFKMPATTKKVSECFYKEKFDETGGLVYPTEQDYEDLLANGNNAKGWDCKEKEAWLIATDVVTYTSTWGGICSGSMGNVPLATLFAVTALHAWVVEKAISRVPCEVVNTAKYDDPFKDYACQTVQGKSPRISCDKHTLKILRNRELIDG